MKATKVNVFIFVDYSCLMLAPVDADDGDDDDAVLEIVAMKKPKLMNAANVPDDTSNKGKGKQVDTNV